MQQDTDFLDAQVKLQKQAESARFCVYMIGLCGKPVSQSWPEAQRAVDIKREMSVLRSKIGMGKDLERVPKPLYTKLVAWVTSKK